MEHAKYLADAAYEAFEMAQEQSGEVKAQTLAEGQLLATLAVYKRLDEELSRGYRR
ncbi:MAG TPA: hypothetical protein PK781_03305 [Terrimesophilobacter sp.]|nr:hypothetical protein [Terrimesophilobacter sp.]HRP99469.1 hypothetical protein [Terrimesophilobacter sp.]